MMKVLTIIVSYNFEPWIHKCIPSLLDSSYPTDILVVDNASKDNTINIIKAQYPSIILIESKENLGFGKANNVGIKYAIDKGYDYIYLVNQDAWLDRDCIRNLLMSNAPIKAMLSPVHFDGTEKELDRGFATYCQHINFNRDIAKVDFVNAAFWFIPVEIIKNIGSFSPIFYHYGEDKDFTNRLQYHHIEIYVVLNARGYHDRQDRVESSGVNSKGEFVFHLTELCNINYNWPEALTESILATYLKAGKYFLKGNIEASKEYIRIASKLWNKIGEVKETRKKNKTIGSYSNT